MAEDIEAIREIKIVPVGPDTIEFQGPNVDRTTGDINLVAPGSHLRFTCSQPFAIFVKKYLSKGSGSDENPIVGDEKVHGAKVVNREYVVVPRVKGRGNVNKGDQYSYGVAWLNADGVLKLKDPRILID